MKVFNFDSFNNQAKINDGSDRAATVSGKLDTDFYDQLLSRCNSHKIYDRNQWT